MLINNFVSSNQFMLLSYVYTVNHQYPTCANDNPYRYESCQDRNVRKTQVILWLETISIFSQEMLKDIIAKCCINKTDDCSYQHITKIMHTQIHSGITGYERPKTQE